MYKNGIFKIKIAFYSSKTYHSSVWNTKTIDVLKIKLWQGWNMLMNYSKWREMILHSHIEVFKYLNEPLQTYILHQCTQWPHPCCFLFQVLMQATRCCYRNSIPASFIDTLSAPHLIGRSTGAVTIRDDVKSGSPAHLTHHCLIKNSGRGLSHSSAPIER